MLLEHDKNKYLPFFIRVLILTIGLFFLAVPAYAKELSIEGVSELNGGQFYNSEIVDGDTDIRIAVDSSWNALTWKTPDKSISVGSAFTTDGTSIYVLRGVGDVVFWKYSPIDDSWTTLANAPYSAYYGSDIQFLHGYVYVVFGGYQQQFARYSISDNTWEILKDYPELVYQGASMTTDGTDIYAISANNTQSYYKYIVSTDTWVPLASTPSTFRAGADLEYVNGYIYTPRGNNTNTFYRYDPAGNSWTQMANMPGTMNDDVDITSYNNEIYVARQNNTTDFYKYNIASDTWITLASAPMTSRYAGVQRVSNDGILYFFRGNGDYRFWKYDTNTNSFVGPSDAPYNLGVGSDAVYSDGALYVTRGGNSTVLYKYIISTNTWVTLASAPGAFNDDVRGFLAGNSIYFFRGSGTTSFYRYNISTDTWDTLAVAPATVRYGGALAYPGSGDYVYALRGQNTNTFWRYSISSNSWSTTVASLPTGILASYGATLVSDWSNNLYFTAGSGIKRMFKYSIADDTWTELSALPYSPYYGSDTTYSGDGKILALAGWYKTDLWEYTIATDTWKYLKKFAAYSATNIGAWQGASVVTDYNGNFFVTRGGNRPEMLVYNPGAYDYESYGSWTSPVHDLSYVSSWNSVEYDGTTPSDSAIVIQTRTSSDCVSWSNWESLNSGNVVSPPNRYIEFKVGLTSSSDHTATSLLKSLKLDYESDTSLPSAPTNGKGYSNEVGGTELSESESYNYTSPYFTWDASTDSETQIDGYYVYWGTDSNADPVTEGSFQSDTSYSAVNTGATLGNNYLKVVAKDSLGNCSAASTLFTYNYQGVAPVVSLEVKDTDLESGVLSNMQVTGGVLKLQSYLGGFWLEDRLTPPTVNLGYGAKNVAYVESSGKLYIPSGMNAQFYEYDLNTNIWTRLSDAPQTIYYGGGAVTGPEGYIYVARGNNSTDFYRYNIASDTWDTDIASAPLTIGYGGSMVFDGYQYIYVLRGNNSDFFWRYDTFSDKWETLSRVDYGAPANTVNNNAYTSASIAIDISNKKIYATQGNYQSGFSVYDIDTDHWTAIGNTPILPYYGSSLAFDDLSGNLYLTAGNYNPYLYEYNINDGTWYQLANSPLGFYYGGGIVAIDGYLYGIRGNNTNGFYRYDIEKDSWLLPKRGLFSREFEGSSLLNAYYGADILKGDNDNYYITRGYYADDFIRWNEKTGELVRLSNIPVGAYIGSSMVYDNTDSTIYLSGGSVDTGFFKYDIENDIWTEIKEDPTPVAVNTGSSMVYDGNQYIYLTRGGGANTVYRFDTLGTAGSRWSTVSNITGTVGYGGELLLTGGSIYALRGNNTNSFYKYDIGSNTWSTLASTNSSIYNDGFLVDGNNGFFYAARGSNTSEFFKYSVAQDSWSTLPDFPGQIYAGGAGESNGLNAIYVLAGSGTNTYQDALYTYVMQTDDSSFVREGTYTSDVHDLGSVYKWADISVDFEKDINTNIQIQTSTSSDEVSWSDWAVVTRERISEDMHYYKINSPVARYIKVRISAYSGDGILSPVVQSYTVNYYQDSDKPVNPGNGGFNPQSSINEGVNITENIWYNYSNPTFAWAESNTENGASDGANGSGVYGYYVYWGTDSDADPSELGTFQTENAFTSDTLTTSGTYYLKLQTVDEAGNIADSVWNAFTYKFDGTGPSAPSNLSADPSGYTSVDSFAFTWDSVSTDGASVEEYCYKTGASEGTFATEQCTNNATISNITSYKVGANTFYVRAKDEAGNYSPYASVSYFYVDSDHAPAPPLNLSVDPTSSTSNSFGFNWNAPASGTYYGSQSNLSYLYSVNALPTEFSTSATSLTHLNSGAYATLPGENILYIVTKDEAGNVNYSNYSQVSFYANTVAPGIPVNLEIADVSVKNTSSWRLAISWDEPQDLGSGVSGYQVYRSVDGDTFTYHSYTSGNSLVDSRLIQMTYYYKVKACDSTNNCGAFSEIVSLYPDGRYTEPAELIVQPEVTGITPKKATVSWVTARSADSRVAYGTESGVYFDEEVSNSDQVVDHILTMNNLNPGTKYYYVVRWTDEDGNIGNSEEGTFETNPPPSIEEPVVKRVGLNTALIEFKIKDATKVKVLYGESSSFGGVLDVYTGTEEGTHSVDIVDLKDGTKYYYKINTFDIDGTEYEGEIHSFETLPRPQVLDPKIYQVSGTSATTLLIEWSSNTATSSIVTYYPSSQPQLAKDEVNVALKEGIHRMVLLNLEANTQYSIIIRGRDFMNNEAVSPIQVFKTASDTRPPQIYDLSVTTEIIGSGQNSTAQLVVSYKSDEPSTSQVEFGEGTGTSYSQKSQEDPTYSENHVVIISGLTPSKVYHLKAVSKDADGNTGTSIDKVVVTNQASEDVLNLAIKNLTSIFSFLGK